MLLSNGIQLNTIVQDLGYPEMGFSDGFGARLREERERLGLSQGALGKFAGVAKLAQLNYEKGVRSPTVEYIDAVASAGVDTWYVLTGERFEQTGVDASLLAACMSAVEDHFSGSETDRAQFSALLYQSVHKKNVDYGQLSGLAEAMLTGWETARKKFGL